MAFADASIFTLEFVVIIPRVQFSAMLKNLDYALHCNLIKILLKTPPLADIDQYSSRLEFFKEWTFR